MGWKTSELPRYTVSAAQLSKGMSISPMLGLYYREVCKFKCTCGREPEYAYMLVRAQLWVCFHVRVGFWMCESSCLFACAWCMCTCMPLNYTLFLCCLLLSLMWKKNPQNIQFFFMLILLSVRCFVFVTHYRLSLKYVGKENWPWMLGVLFVDTNMTKNRIQSFAKELYWLFNH